MSKKESKSASNNTRINYYRIIDLKKNNII